MYKLNQLSLPGCYELLPKVHEDLRGRFVKTFHSSEFEKNELVTNFKEDYYSVSKHNVIRGMHFQAPPFDHVKLVYCLSGEIQDVLLDLRKNSSTYGQVATVLLSSNIANILYIPKGIAHGFHTKTKSATVVYKVSEVYNFESDLGIRWDSFGYKWQVKSPIVSDRDRGLINFNEFNSPFIYEK